MQTARDTAEVMQEALTQARRVVADKGFVQLLYDCGVQSIPRPLVAVRPHAKDHLDPSIDFIIAWTFLFPLMKKPAFATYLQTAWPGFDLRMKDAFIAAVVEGPFPCAFSGFRGRRGGTTDRAGQRPVASRRQTV